MADISRAEVSTLIEEAYAHTLLEASVAASTALQTLRTVNMGTKTTHLPVLATLPEAGWVAESATDPTGIKPTSEVSWKDLTLVAEEIAVIIPVHENVIDDATVAIVSELAARGGEAIGKKLDQAVFFGTDKPASWVSDSLFEAAVAAGQTVAITLGAANANDIVGAVNLCAREVAKAGFMPDALVGPLTLRYDVENIRDANGFPIFRDGSLGGFQTSFNRNGAWDYDDATFMVFDSSRAILGVRQDIQVKLLDQATVGSVNLAERDMIGVRMKARFAYVLGVSTTSLGVDQTPVAAATGGGS